jgi:hypothetical protein
MDPIQLHILIHNLLDIGQVLVHVTLPSSEPDAVSGWMLQPCRWK